MRYLGVMIDDLVTRGITEPYRMFTSRAEYRLTLRADNADQRLTPRGIEIGCVAANRAERFSEKMAKLLEATALARSRSISPDQAVRFGLVLNRDGQRRTAYELLSYPHLGMADISRVWPEFGAIEPKIAEQLEIDAKYAVYLERQGADIERFRREEAMGLPDAIDYAAIPGLSNELKQKLGTVRPLTLGQANRIDGMTPAALALAGSARTSSRGMTTAEFQKDRAAALRLVPVSRETVARLDEFVALLLRWQKAVQLVAPSTLPKLWTRHIADSLQIVELVPEAKRWIDLGSGGGFPGLVVAIALAHIPDAIVHLVESNARKAAFLREAVRTTGAPAKVHHERVESVAERFAGDVEIVTARALAPLARLLEFAEPLLSGGARGVFLKGQDVDNELTQAAKSWNISAETFPSRTDPRGRILIIEHAVRQNVAGQH